MHDVYVGPTGCGKTFLAIAKARAWLAGGVNVLVCDPFFSPWPETAKDAPVKLWHTHERERFMWTAKRSRKCALFIDEGGQTLARDKDAEWLFTGARHWGHKTHAMVQDGVQMLPVMRGQCSTVALFACDERVAQVWASAFCEPGLMAAASKDFPRFEAMYAQRWKPLRRIKVAV